MKFKTESLKNRLKSYLSEAIKKIRIIHRLDYDKFPIYLHDNIRLSACKKEPETVKWIETFSKDDIVFDVGANVGAYTLIMAKYAKKVYAFEPSVFNYGTLIKNVHTNKASNIVPLNIALSEHRKIGVFKYSSTESGGSCNSFEGNIFGNDVAVYAQEILSYTIDSLVEDFKIEPPNHIKLDVDGIEFDILKGAVKTISKDSFKSLIVELDGRDKEAFDFISRLGLRVEQIHELGHEHIKNFLFTKEESYASTK